MNDTYRFKTANTFTISPNSIHSKIVKEFATIVFEENRKQRKIPVANHVYSS
jgi:hypothetical protein